VTIAAVLLLHDLKTGLAPPTRAEQTTLEDAPLAITWHPMYEPEGEVLRVLPVEPDARRLTVSMETGFDDFVPADARTGIAAIATNIERVRARFMTFLL